jgi:dynein heavy chain
MRNKWIQNSIVNIAYQPVLFVGKSGTGKPATASNFLTSLDPETIKSKIINFSNQTTSMNVQLGLKESFDSPTKDSFCPKESKSMALLLDDVNMHAVDIYGTQQSIALLKLLIERGGIYDGGGDLIWKMVQKLAYIAAMAQPGGARAVLDIRFAPLFNIFHVISLFQDSLHHIFDTILGARVFNFSEEVQHAYKIITSMVIKLYVEIVAKMPSTPSKFHYLFNLRDIKKVFEGICKSTPSIFSTIGQFVLLWKNECERVFHDRLINLEDRNIVRTKIENFITTSFPNAQEESMKQPSIFGDFLIHQNTNLSKDLNEYLAYCHFPEKCLKILQLRRKPKLILFFLIM